MNFINLNLLTKEDKKNLRYEIAMLAVKDAFSILFVVAAVVAILFISSKMILKNNYEAFIAASQLVEKQNPALQKTITQINSDTAALGEIQKQWSPIHGVVLEVSRAIKPPARLASFSYDASEKNIHLSGTSPSRENVIELEKELKLLSFVESVDSPLENILRARDVEFVFELKLK